MLCCSQWFVRAAVKRLAFRCCTKHVAAQCTNVNVPWTQRPLILAVQVDGVKNAKVQSVFLEDLPIHHAAFAAGGNQVGFKGTLVFACSSLWPGCVRRRFLMVAAALHLVGPAFEQLHAALGLGFRG